MPAQGRKNAEALWAALESLGEYMEPYARRRWTPIKGLRLTIQYRRALPQEFWHDCEAASQQAREAKKTRKPKPLSKALQKELFG